MKLHGCVECNNYIWDEEDKSVRCPNRNCAGHRFDEKGHPFEEVTYFPLKSRLEALLRDSPAFLQALKYPSEHRSQDPDLITGECKLSVSSIYTIFNTGLINESQTSIVY